MGIHAVAVIPARLGSTRLSEKVLRYIDGKPMIQHVWERAKKANRLSDVIVACDDSRIVNCVNGFGGKAVLTGKDHANGTSRVAEVAAETEADVFINVQGDEPMMNPNSINLLVEAFEKDASVEAVTLAVQKTDRTDYEDPNVVKVVLNDKSDALYFSRAPIPHYRDPSDEAFFYFKHMGVYGYRKKFLLNFVSWEPTPLEQKEKLEQLRILEKGFKMRVIEVQDDSLSVDTAQDLKEVEKKMKDQSGNSGVI